MISKLFYLSLFKREVTPSDYSILLTNIPLNQNINYESELRDYIEGFSDVFDKSIEVTDIIFPFTLTHYNNRLKELTKLIEEKKNIYE